MAKYNSEKTLSQLNELTVDELYAEHQKVKDLLYQKIVAEQKIAEEKANELQSKADSLNATNN